jgi:hypothetical protein
MDRNKVKEISADVEAALQAVATKHGLTVSVRGGVFTQGSFKPRVEFKTGDADRAEFEQYARAFGLTPEMFGKTFAAPGGARYRIAGLRLNSRKRPVLVQRLDGKQFVFEVAAVLAALAREVQA